MHSPAGLRPVSAAKVSGSRFYYLTGIGARLELALVNLAMDLALDAGFTPMVPPVLVKPSTMEGTGFLGQAAENVYRIELDDMVKPYRPQDHL
jgi:seryl-tRNA synthetase